MSDLQQVIRARDSQSCEVKPRKISKWIIRANKDIKIWEKLMKHRYPKKYWSLKLLSFNIGI